MAVAACDFDGTLLRNGHISHEDQSAVKAWRAAGNVFGIVTGRGISTLLDAMRRTAPLHCDFLICNNGALICDGDAQELCHAELSETARSILLKHPVMKACRQCILFAGTQAYLHADKAPYWIHPENRLPMILPETAQKMPLHQISLAYPDTGTAEEWVRALEDSGKGKIAVHLSSICIDITACCVSKTEGIRQLVNKRKWNESILVMGDDGNDLSMIRDLNGYAISSAEPAVRNAASAVFDSVADMLHAHLGHMQFSAVLQSGSDASDKKQSAFEDE